MGGFDLDRNAVRAALLPLDWPRATLTDLFTDIPAASGGTVRRFEAYVTAALDQTTIDPCRPAGIQEYEELLTFAGLAALRIQFAEPFAESAYEAREPPNSAERRMMARPLWKHPGLTRFCERARRYFIATTRWVFAEELPAPLQSEIASVLIAPDPIDGEAPPRAYARDDPDALYHRYHDRIEITADSVWIPGGHISRCCQVRPTAAERFQSLDFGQDPPHVGGGGLTIPRRVFELKLAEYAWHGWARLVHCAYHSLTKPDIDRLRTRTRPLRARLCAPFARNNTVYQPYYGTNTENPQRRWIHGGTEHPLQIEDKRLLTVVDCIRAAPDLHFEEWIGVEKLFDRLRMYFPPPHRPGNDIDTEETLRRALESAISDQIRLYTGDGTSQAVCQVPGPTATPYYPDNMPHWWDRFLSARGPQSRSEPDRTWRRRSVSDGPRQFVDPRLPEAYRPEGLTDYEAVREGAQRAAASTPVTISSVHDVEPLRPPAKVSGLTPDEICFLTRIGLAMERRIDDVSLIRSMRPLRYRADGSELDIDVSKLERLGWVQSHPETRSILYTVTATMRDHLGIQNVSHDGYGETTTAEKSLHRRGVDCCALALAARSDVQRVVRYCDLWRLRNTACAAALTDHNLFSTRVDVLAFGESGPRYAAGVETAANAPAKPRRCVSKLRALSSVDGMETALVVPNSDHLWTVMRQLDHPEYCELSSFPNSTATRYSRSNWERLLRREGVLGAEFDFLHTYRSIEQSIQKSNLVSLRSKIVGHV